MALEIPLSWKLSVQGAENVKQKLQDINNQFNRGEISADDYDKGLIKVNRSARSLANISTTQKSIWLGTHPIINNLTRAMSTMRGVFNSALAITNALNLMFIRQQGDGSALARIQRDIAEATRDYNKALQEGNPEAMADALERLNIAKAEEQEYYNEQNNKKINDYVTAISAMGLAVSSTAGLIKNFGPQFSGFINLFTSGGSFSPNKLLGGGLIGLGALGLATGGFDALIGKSDKLEDKLKAIGSIAALGVGITTFLPPGLQQIALIGTAIAVALVAIIVFRKELEGFFVWLGGALAPIGESIMKFFTVDLPTWFAISLEALIPLWASMKDGFTMLVNGIIGVLNTLGSGIVAGLNIAGQAIVDAINSLIKKYKKLRDSLGKFGSLLPPLDLLTFTPLTFTAIPLIAAAKGFEGMVSNPTMFLAGEAGPEMVSITPRGSSGGKTIQVFVNIHGSVWSEKEVSNVVLGKLKDQLKSLNF